MGTCRYLGGEGDRNRPVKSDAPQESYLAYGPSITHGGMALMTPWTYPFQVPINLSGLYESGAMQARLLWKTNGRIYCFKKDWTFASVEMGINMLKSL